MREGADRLIETHAQVRAHAKEALSEDATPSRRDAPIGLSN